MSASCSTETAGPQEFQPVTSRAIQALEAEIRAAEPPPLPPPDSELITEVRSRAANLASESGPMRPMLTLSARDFGDAAVPILAQVLAEANLDAAVRSAAAEMLAAIDSPASAAILAYHASDNPVSWMRAQCAFRLASTTQDHVVPRLITAHRLERDAEAAMFLARTLAHFGCTSYLEPGATARAVEPPSARFKLAVWQAIQAVGSGDVEARAADLGRLPAFAAGPLAEALIDVDPAVRVGAARALEHMGARASAAGPALLEALVRDQHVESAAIAALGAVHHSAAVPEIERRLSDRSRPLAVRVAAARALGALDAARALSLLEAAQDEDEPPELRAAAAEAARVLQAPVR
ncbi:MAG: HEAT repeat domain-containing protein [Planctomycetes bacterium]|nr:HEAT repeat domain-containing protein [Planctomycetota bacterium]